MTEVRESDVLDEVVLAVDADGNEMGARTRGEIVNTPGIFPYIVYGFLYRVSTKDIWIPARQDFKHLHPGKLDASTAEHRKPDESSREALSRGINEELGMAIGFTAIRGALLTPSVNGTESVVDVYQLEVEVTDEWSPPFSQDDYSSGEWGQPQAFIDRIKSAPEIARPDLIIALQALYDSE